MPPTITCIISNHVFRIARAWILKDIDRGEEAAGGSTIAQL